ncbi:hypothetical protein J6590_040052 [Homalodisca vitripennis]|nr:hypothetical protein J6590_040052 [Homalodisca vitripennis]
MIPGDSDFNLSRCFLSVEAFPGTPYRGDKTVILQGVTGYPVFPISGSLSRHTVHRRQNSDITGYPVVEAFPGTPYRGDKTVVLQGVTGYPAGNPIPVTERDHNTVLHTRRCGLGLCYLVVSITRSTSTIVACYKVDLIT